MGSYLLRVTDYGEGADRESYNEDGTKNGLNGIRERLKLVNGEMQFESIKGQGTSVTFKVPHVNRSSEVGESKR
ncbi:Histidine kinase-, DNA gyrase B-, and HSP90-like ATPase [compost metagenome]